MLLYHTSDHSSHDKGFFSMTEASLVMHDVVTVLDYQGLHFPVDFNQQVCRSRPLAKVISLHDTYLENLGLWFVWRTYKYIATKKFSKGKTFQVLGKRVICDYLFIKLYYSKQT